MGKITHKVFYQALMFWAGEATAVVGLMANTVAKKFWHRDSTNLPEKFSISIRYLEAL